MQALCAGNHWFGMLHSVRSGAAWSPNSEDPPAALRNPVSTWVLFPGDFEGWRFRFEMLAKSLVSRFGTTGH